MPELALGGQRVLLVDDSEAVLALERAVLSRHYSVSTASNGLEALEKISRLRPHVVLLDLSMPEMDGDEVIARLQKDPLLATIPVVVVSSEHQRALDFVGKGAVAALLKPVRAQQLLETVGTVLKKASVAQHADSLEVLAFKVGGLTFALPLRVVESVHAQPAVFSVPGPPFLRSGFVLRGAPLALLELGRLLGAPHEAELLQRQVIVVERPGLRFGVGVDQAHAPQQFLPHAVTPRERLDGHAVLPAAVTAMLSTEQGVVPLLDPFALLSRRSETRLRDLGLGAAA